MKIKVQITPGSAGEELEEMIFDDADEAIQYIKSVDYQDAENLSHE